MGFATSPFTLEPVRSNEFKQAQISKEIYSLTSHIDTIKQSIAHIQTQKETKEAREAEEVAKGRRKSALVTNTDTDPDSKTHQTSHYYRTSGLPDRFERPDKWSYTIKKQHPSYTTTTNTYGSKPPSVHEMPTTFKGQSSKFSVVSLSRIADL